MQKLPHEISRYIRNKFREGYISDIKRIENKAGEIIFKARIIEDDIVHHLEFDEKGKVLKHETEPTYEEDYYEGDFYGYED